jgi:toxin YoeB
VNVQHRVWRPGYETYDSQTASLSLVSPVAARVPRRSRYQRDPFAGIGKPEPLKGDLCGYWSRRIDDEHRLVYRAGDKEVKILKARYHYSD